MRRHIGATLFAAMATMLTTQASAGVVPMPPGMDDNVPTSSNPVAIVGEVENGDYLQFLAIVKSTKLDLVVLDSPGGLVDEALLIGAEIRRRGLNTFIYADRSCASACALMFLSGRTKYARYGASLGLHSSAYLDGTPSIEGTAAMGSYLASIGTPASIIEKMSNTAPMNMHWLTDQEKRELSLFEIAEDAQKVRSREAAQSQARFEFLFAPNKVVSMTMAGAELSLNDTFDRIALAERLPGYQLVFESHLEGSQGFYVERNGRHYLTVVGDIQSGSIDMIFGVDAVVDGAGVSVGIPIKSALGSETGTCDFGLFAECLSNALPTLSYTIDWEESCPVEFQGYDKATQLLDCMKVSGFALGPGGQ